jgi:glycosyltransferase involved in cell wall biosynthesis
VTPSAAHDGGPLHLALVTPRYGADVRGGAEQGARGLAEHLVALAGWRVEVFTSTALDSSTWAPHYPPGTTEEGGVTVHRFAGTGRDPGFDRLCADVLSHPERTAPSREAAWFRAQGPVPAGLLDALAASPAHVVAGYPYLYWPIVEAMQAERHRALLHAAAHDEPPLLLPRFREVFGGVRGLVFHSESERRLVERTFPVAQLPSVVLGLGVDVAGAACADPAAARARLGIGERPYLLCLGRVDHGKGTGVLARWFATLRERGGPDVALVFAGPVVDRPPAHPDIVVVGAVSEAEKWDLLAGCAALVNPSGHESFSIVLMEAWAVGRPVLVNALCEVTVDHARASGGGLWYDGYALFEAAVATLLSDRELAAGLGAAGQQYVAARYDWPAVVASYERFVRRVVGEHGT